MINSCLDGHFRIPIVLPRRPVAQSTDATRAKVGFRHGRHAWEVVWEGPLGTVAVVGVATKAASLQCHGYVALLGADEQSWGWNLVDNHLLHAGDTQGNYPLLNNAPKYQVGERIRVILDCDDNTLSFEKNFEFLGVAFRGAYGDLRGALRFPNVFVCTFCSCRAAGQMHVPDRVGGVRQHRSVYGVFGIADGWLTSQRPAASAVVFN